MNKRARKKASRLLTSRDALALELIKEINEDRIKDHKRKYQEEGRDFNKGAAFAYEIVGWEIKKAIGYHLEELHKRQP